MGGYAMLTNEKDNDDSPTRYIRLKPADFLKLAKLPSFELPTKMELMDRSKGDWISKSITLIQIAWFLSQLVGRAVQKLPVTTLELFTCAIIVCTAATYVAWWKKPLDVQRPVILNCEVPAAFLADSRIQPLTTYFSLVDSDMPYGLGLHQFKGRSIALAVILAFTAPHLIGWNFHFPTRAEQLLWRAASVLCAGIPIPLSVVSIYHLGEIRAGSRLHELCHKLKTIGIIAYFLVRGYLLIEVFVGLRSVPAEVYTAVNWSAYIPHI
jgi:hypothetical protein